MAMALGLSQGDVLGVLPADAPQACFLSGHPVLLFQLLAWGTLRRDAAVSDWDRLTQHVVLIHTS